MKIEREDLAHLLSVANDLRRAKGDELLEDLPGSMPRNPVSCLVANAFNYGCNVDPSDGMIFFQNLEDTKAYAKVTGCFTDEVIKNWHAGMWLSDEDRHVKEDEVTSLDQFWDIAERVHNFSAPLNREFSEIAQQFDQHKLPEYEELEGSKWVEINGRLELKYEYQPSEIIAT